MKIAVTGGTGFIGSKLVQSLVSAGHEVNVLGRRSGGADNPALRFFHWDATGQEPPPAASLTGAGAVFHLAGTPVAQRWTTQIKRRIRLSRVDGTRRLVDALARLPERPAVLVCASATGFYGSRGDEVLTEDSAPGSGFLADVCVEWERAARSAEELGIRTVQVRTGLVLGPGGGALDRMLPAFRLGAGGKLGTGQQWMSWIGLDDLVDLMRFAMDNASASGPLNGTSPNPVRNSEFTAKLAGMLRRPAFVSVPGFALKTLLGEMANILLESQRVLPERALAAGFRFRYPGFEDALQHALR
jgi:uncharacterized protein